MSGRARQRAVVTGIGLLTPLGADAAGFFDAVCAGRSGLRRPADTHPVAGILDAAGFAPDIDPATVLPPSEARRGTSSALRPRRFGSTAGRTSRFGTTTSA